MSKADFVALEISIVSDKINRMEKKLNKKVNKWSIKKANKKQYKINDLKFYLYYLFELYDTYNTRT